MAQARKTKGGEGLASVKVPRRLIQEAARLKERVRRVGTDHLQTGHVRGVVEAGEPFTMGRIFELGIWAGHRGCDDAESAIRALRARDGALRTTKSGRSARRRGP